ncbi:hypothetical protein CPB83DRAFT_882092 [Crepidotus variabilis]|uniref:BHLH domain-containing protein n=1 Tax=Crepidotus variabilis TaxID=179855 RepID=A0A9P6EKP1_9AGAR|nr:hypothetical protein CPB83DRAFT_882092 [Crepidotus variabilis]
MESDCCIVLVYVFRASKRKPSSAESKIEHSSMLRDLVQSKFFLNISISGRNREVKTDSLLYSHSYDHGVFQPGAVNAEVDVRRLFMNKRVPPLDNLVAPKDSSLIKARPFIHPQWYGDNEPIVSLARPHSQPTSAPLLHLPPSCLMSECDKDLYAATCNPSRRVKRSAMADQLVDPFVQASKAGAPSGQPRAILPMPTSGSTVSTTQLGQDDSTGQPAAKRARKSLNVASSSDRPYTPRVNPIASPTAEPPPPAKRGRKPGPLSKTAREAQRRLNHSIIEKARRTKINDALATLKQLVPSDYLQAKQNAFKELEDDEDDEDEDEDFEMSNKKPKSKSKKEDKEFKLEILERTVAFLKDLLEKVNTMESNPPAICTSCDTDLRASKKRKRAEVDEVARPGPTSTSVEGTSEPPKTGSHRVSQSPSFLPLLESSKTFDSPTMAAASRGPSASPRTQAAVGERERLPSISSWLPSTAEIDPQLLPPPLVKRHQTNSSMTSSYLPSPPSSTHFDPIRMGGAGPPVLNLGPIATSSPMMFAPRSNTNKSPTLSSTSNNGAARTPDDESAASMLLHIATSPLFRPTSSSLPLPEPSSLSLHSEARSPVQDMDYTRQAQTPSSILGIRKA